MKWQMQGHPTPADVAWERLSDTDWLNRRAGNGQLSVDMVMEDGRPVVVGTIQGPLGITSRFREFDSGWVAGSWFRQQRRYASGPIDTSDWELRLEPVGDGVVRPEISFEVTGNGAVTWAASPFFRRMVRAWQRVLDELPEVGAERPAESRELDRSATAALGQWAADESVSAELREALQGLLCGGRPLELQQMRPYALADRWGLDREEVLLGLLAGVPVGLLELYWSVRCTRCQGEVASSTSLSDLADHASCASCRLDTVTDLADNVEVRFAPHPGILTRETGRFCSVFPAGAPEIRCVWELHGDADVQVPVQPGLWLLGRGGDEPDLRLVVGDQGATEVTWTPGASGSVPVRAGVLTVRVRPGDARGRVQLMEADRRGDAVSAATLTTLPRYRAALGDDVVAPDARVTARAVSLVFTDLSGSTAMYQALGDARAYAVVRDHFRVLKAVIDAHGGVLVKTIGDAVMASFDRPDVAVAAALEMSSAFARFAATLGLASPPRLNVGVHVGQALAVHSDDLGEDYFGSTVNLAARAQGAAQDGAIVITESVRVASGVGDLLTEHARTPEAFRRHLKGIGEQELFRLVPTP